MAPSVRLGAPSLQRVAAFSPTMLAAPPRRAERSRALAASIPAEADAPAGGIGAGWRYAGRFSARPTPVQLERAVRAALEAEPYATEF